MKPVVIDTSLWVKWLRGELKQTKTMLENRFLWMPSVVALELGAGARTKQALSALHLLLKPFERNRRIVVLSWEDYVVAGETLGHMGWSSNAHMGDLLITMSAKKIGAEVWTLNVSDFRPLGENLGVPIFTP